MNLPTTEDFALEVRRQRREQVLRQQREHERREYWARQHAIIEEKRRNRVA